MTQQKSFLQLFRDLLAPKGKEREGLAELFFSVVIVFSLAWFLRSVVVAPFYVDGISMRPTLGDHDLLIGEKLFFHLSKPRRGDIVVFRPPSNPGTYFVKRVIGLPGETIIFRGGEVLLKNTTHPEEFQLEEEFLSKENGGKTFLPSRKDREIFIPSGHFFLLGDNRNHSSDSRAWQETLSETHGTVPRSSLAARVVARVWVDDPWLPFLRSGSRLVSWLGYLGWPSGETFHLPSFGEKE